MNPRVPKDTSLAGWPHAKLGNPSPKKKGGRGNRNPIELLCRQPPILSAIPPLPHIPVVQQV